MICKLKVVLSLEKGSHLAHPQDYFNIRFELRKTEGVVTRSRARV